MTGLWTDSWFYISLAGFLSSAVLLAVFVAQYRAAAKDDSDSAESSASAETPAAESETPAVVAVSEVIEDSAVEQLPSAEVSAVIHVSETAVSHSEPETPSVVTSPAREPAPSGISHEEFAALQSAFKDLEHHAERLSEEIESLKESARRQEARSEETLKILTELSERVSKGWTPIQINGAEAAPVAEEPEAHEDRPEEEVVVEPKTDEIPVVLDEAVEAASAVEPAVPAASADPEPDPEPAPAERPAPVAVIAELEELPVELSAASSVIEEKIEVAVPTAATSEPVEEAILSRKGPIWPV